MRTILHCLWVPHALLFLTVARLHAQPGAGGMPSGRIAGSISTQESGEAVPGAAVAVWSAKDSTLTTGVIAKVDGSFVVEGLRPGEYFLKITSIGYAPHVVPGVSIEPGALRIELGRVELLPDSTQAGENVVVSTDRPDVEFRSDRTVYNVENQPATSGRTTVDVLKNVPQVQVDANDRVSLRGSQNVAVHINGRPVPLNGDALSGYLKALPAETVKSVEVIPNPSAKYDPDGMAGIINIVLKQGNAGGASGNATVSASTSRRFGATGSLALRADRLAFFSTYGFDYDERHSDATQYQVNRLVTPNTAVDITTGQFGITRGHVFNGTLDYHLNAGNSSTLSLSTVLSTRDGSIEEKNAYLYRETGGETPGSASRFSLGADSWLDMDYALNWRRAFEPGRHEFTAEARYTSNALLTERGLTEWPLGPDGARGDSILQRQENELDNFNRAAVLQVDYTHPIGEKGRLESGYKGELMRIDNTFYSETLNAATGEFQPDAGLNNEFEYDVDIHGIYATYGHVLGKFDAQVGLRAEQAYTDFVLVTNDETFTNDYFSLFPSASVLWSPNEHYRIQAAYSKRINRPQTWQLNPFVNYEDRLNLNAGNPHLRPEYMHSVELGLNRFMPWGSISVTPYFRHRDNMIERWSTIDSSGVSTIRFENFNSTNTFGAEIVGTYRVKDKVRGFANASIYHFDLDGGNVETNLANKALSWHIFVNSTWTPVAGFDIQAAYFYRAPIKISRGRIEPYHSASITARKSLFGDRASVALHVDDIFRTAEWELYKDDPTYYTDLRWTWTSQQATLSFTWNFGRQDPALMRRQRQGSGGGGGDGAPGGAGV